MNRIITKQRVASFCESCLVVLGHIIVLVLGSFVIGAIAFAVYRGFADIW